MSLYRFGNSQDLRRGKWSHFPLSKIRVQPARMILIIILIFAYYIIFQWKNVKNITFKQESNYENFHQNSGYKILSAIQPRYGKKVNVGTIDTASRFGHWLTQIRVQHLV